MEQVVLNKNLKYILSGLDMKQRGELFTAVLEEEYTGSDEMVKNIYIYIHDEAENFSKKRQHMQELGKKSAIVRARKNNGVATTLKRCLLRKEAKEEDLNINNNIHLFSQKKGTERAKIIREFVAPTVKDVREFVLKNQLKVDPQVFVDFYESHGWMVGHTPICNWQATVRLWHQRSVSADKKGEEKNLENRQEDERYWSDLEERVTSCQTKETEILDEPKPLGLRQNVAVDQQNETDLDFSGKPFERFMRRVKKYDIKAEEDHE